MSGGKGMTDRKGAVVIDLDESETAEGTSPASAPPVPDPGLPETGSTAMAQAAALAARRPSRVAGVFWSALLALLVFAASVAATNFVTGLLASHPVLGWIAGGLLALVLASALLIAWREWRAFARIARLGDLHQRAEAARASGLLPEARSVVARIDALYRDRPELAEGRDRLGRLQQEVLDVDGLFSVAEAELLQPLDRRAQAEVSAAARQVATVTALVPLALADVIAALTANLRMIRRIAEIYGGRSGTLGSWRLTRAVLAHLVATGAVAVGDDLIGSVAGGGVLSKVSRRFGEGVVNGALTARVGVAAMEVCRPLPFGEGRRPSVTRLVKQALTGLFSQRT